ncbi:MAG TPA: DUF1996 domain-containing protein [Candidatus Binatia bacterium]|nr:DUF1996 domain-containing protein [Candidatus Binatia bacterium]
MNRPGAIITAVVAVAAAVAVPLSQGRAAQETASRPAASGIASPSPPPPAAAAPPLTSPAVSVGIMVEACGYSHSSNADPILMPGMAGMSMLHDFFGNTTTSASSTAAGLRGGPTTCANRGDGSAYWTPALYDDGAIVTPVRASLYWIAPRTSNVVTTPEGLQLIAGSEHATAPQGEAVVSWSCVVSGDPVTVSHGAMPVPCAQGLEKVAITFPNCWDGHTLSGASQTNAVYAVAGRCPAGFPVMIPQLVVHVLYHVSDTNITLSTAPGQTASAATAHADFINGWNQATLAQIVAGCISAHQHCNAQGRLTPRTG